MMKSFKAFLVTIAVVSASFQMPSMGAATVTASKNYVDMKTKVEVVTNAEVGVAGYTVGTNTNCVFASTNYVDSKLGNIKTDLITDGTNTIDAAGNVTRIVYRDAWMGSDGNVYTNVVGTTRWISIYPAVDPVYDDSMAGYLEWAEDALGYIGEEGAGWYFNNDESSGSPYGVYAGPLTATSLPGLSRGDYSKVSKLALTNDIPPAIQVVAPSTNAVKGTAADAKATGTALYTGFTEWEFSGYSDGVVIENLYYNSEQSMWLLSVSYEGQIYSPDTEGNGNETNLSFIGFYKEPYDVITATRHLVTPTKTSQLENDGDGTNKFVTANQIPAPTDLSPATNYTDAVASEFEDGTRTVQYANFASEATSSSDSSYLGGYDGQWYLQESTNAAVAVADAKISTNNSAFVSAVLAVPLTGADASDISELSEYGGYGTVGAAILALIAGLAALKRRVTSAETAIYQKANTSDLPYRLVEPGEWEFSGQGYDAAADYEIDYTAGSWYLRAATGDPDNPYVDLDQVAGDANDLSVDFVTYQITATRASLPGHLCDRAVNAVPVTGATTLTLPWKIDGKSRDFYVRLTVSAAGDGSAVTFSSTDSGGDAVAWDTMGDPSGTFAEGTCLYRLTEVADGVFHAVDITDGGSIDPAALDMKLDATSAAPAFDHTLTYIVGEYVTYGGILYRCKTAVTVAGTWTGDSNWVDVDMTSPDATLDIRSDGRLAVVAADSEILWIQGYDMAAASDVVLSCDRVNLLKFPVTTAEAFDSTVAYAVGDRVVYGGMVYKFTAAHSAGDWIGTDAALDSVAITMPNVPVGKVGDFVLDVDNSANASVKMVADLSGLFTSFDVIIPKGQNLFTDILTFDGGEMCELYFTMTAFGTAAKPAWKVVKQVVEKQEAGS